MSSESTLTLPSGVKSIDPILGSGIWQLFEEHDPSKRVQDEIPSIGMVTIKHAKKKSLNPATPDELLVIKIVLENKRISRVKNFMQ